jgi:hypothetical protein
MNILASCDILAENLYSAFILRAVFYAVLI